MKPAERKTLRSRAISDAARAASLAMLAALLATGCASLNATPVEEARLAVEAARADANVASGSLDLQLAEEHLKDAEAALDAGRFQARVDHEAYMASSYAQVAVVLAEARLAEQETSDYLARAVLDSRKTREQVELAVARARALDAEQTERGLVLTLGGVLFGFDSAELKPEARLSLARIAGFLIAAGDREVLVEGFTDDVGSEEYNVQLSKQRAEAVTAALVENRVEDARILAAGLGPAFPVASNESPQGRAQNRRVEVVILDPGISAAQASRARTLPGVATAPE